MDRSIAHAARLAVCLALGLVGCGNKSDSPRAKDDAATGPAAAPLAIPPLGADQIKRFNFMYEAGASAYEKTVAAYRKKDWPAVKTHAEAALAKDPSHLAAHRLLAAALSQTGEPAAAVDHLVTAVAADYLQYAPTLVDDDLKSFMASPHGQSVQALAAKIGDEYKARIARALWMVGRRAAYRWPREFGVQNSTSRGEIYAFDRETRRFFRLTHTEHQVVGFVRPASGNEVALLGFDRIDRTKPDGDDELPPLFARPWIQLYDTAAWKAAAARITLSPAREVALGYGTGDQLLVSLAQAAGRWTVGEPAMFSVDRTTGKLTKVATALPAPRIVVSLDEGQVVRAPDVVAAWTAEPPVAPTLKTATGKVIQVPESGAASQSSIAISPSGAHIAFATAVDPCAKDAAPSLYVADAKSATYKHLLSAKSRFATRWLDATTLAYEDGDGAIRLWDAMTGREAMRLDNKPGIALDVLSLAAAPLCKQAPPTVDAAGSGDEPMPPEEGSSPGSAQGTGPVTTPQ